MKYNVEAIKKAIQIAGGATQLAHKLGVSYQTVLTWKNARSSVSPTNCVKIEKVTEGAVSRREILPEFPWDETE